MKMVEALDPVSKSVLWNFLVAIPAEMGLTLKRTALSKMLREADDFATALFDAKGTLIAEGQYTPGQLASLPAAMQHVLRYYPPETLAPGDAIALNDPWMGTGHLPDLFLFTPVFFAEEIVAFAAAVGHHVDVGGLVSGSQAVAGVTELYQEGLRLEPVKLYKGGRLDAELERIIRANVRLPDLLISDIKAQRNANRVGEQRLLSLIHRYGRDDVLAAMEQVVLEAEARIRRAIGRMKNGIYSFADFIDDYGPGTEPIRLQVTLTVGDDTLHFDFTGTDPQVPAGMNSYINYTKAYTIFAARCYTDPEVPQNAGCLRPIEITVPEGSFLNPRLPAPCSGRALVCHRLYDVVGGALAQAAPERAMAAPAQGAHPIFDGMLESSGRQFVFYEGMISSLGGRAGRDGTHGLNWPANGGNIPIEVLETATPLRVERFELMVDTGGPGKYRGGCAVHKVIRVQADGVSLQNITDRHRFAPYGLFGGHAGTSGGTTIERGQERIPIHSKGRVTLQRDDLVHFHLSSGGGYGDPLARDPSAVAQDVENGYVSAAAARDVYGVVFDGSSTEVNQLETSRLRARLTAIRNMTKTGPVW